MVDSSAWIEYLRRTGSHTNTQLRELIAGGAELATTEVVVMELLAGAADSDRREKLRRLLYGFELLRVEGLTTFEHAAEIYRHCRANGATVRSLNDCLIAAVAIEAGAQLMHFDRDFESVAKSTSLELFAGLQT